MEFNLVSFSFDSFFLFSLLFPDLWNFIIISCHLNAANVKRKPNFIAIRNVFPVFIIFICVTTKTTTMTVKTNRTISCQWWWNKYELDNAAWSQRTITSNILQFATIAKMTIERCWTLSVVFNWKIETPSRCVAHQKSVFAHQKHMSERHSTKNPRHRFAGGSINLLKNGENCFYSKISICCSWHVIQDVYIFKISLASMELVDEASENRWFHVLPKKKTKTFDMGFLM